MTKKYLISVRHINYPKTPYYSLIYLDVDGKIKQEDRDVVTDKIQRVRENTMSLYAWMPCNYTNPYWKPEILDQKGIDNYFMLQELLK